MIAKGTGAVGRLNDKLSIKVHSPDLFLLQMLACVSILFLLMAYEPELINLHLETISKIILFCIASILFFVFRISPRGIWSASSVYLTVFFLFHFGIWISLVFGFSIDYQFFTYVLRWFYSEPAKTAVVLSCIGFAACGTGVHMASLTLNDGYRDEHNSEHLNLPITYLGFSILSFAVIGWFYIVFRTGGIDLLTSSYGNFLKVTEETSLPIVYYGIGLGLVFLAATRTSTYFYVGIIAFLVFSIFALPLGLRGEVLFPTIAALVVAAKRKLFISAKFTVVLGLCLLSSIAILKGVRHSGLRDVRLTEVGGNPLNALVELGGSLRSVAEVVTWRDMGDNLIYGSSYWAPLDRALIYIIPDHTRPPAENDERLSNILIRERVGQIGFSPVAEAYRNFGKFGVMFVMFLIGYILGMMDISRVTRFNQAVIGVVFLPLLINIRNDFTPVPAQVIMGFMILFFGIVLTKSLKSLFKVST
jgi:oligosaccharide repeat unit polymerase